MYVVGIDPGKMGAVAFLHLDQIYIYDCPVIGKHYDERGMAKTLQRFPIKTAWLEDVHAFPKQGVVSMFNFGMGKGLWLGILAALDISYSLVSPQKWKKDLLSGMPKEKESSIIVANRLYPRASDFLKRKRDHNRADALLIAEYGRRQIEGGTQ